MTDSQITFAELELAAPLQQALEDLGYNTPSDIQAQAIPALLDGRDLLGSAQTGTGKTAAFALPILHHLIESPSHPISRCPRVLVLTPTRELAQQVGESFTKYGKHTRISNALVYGGVGARDQIKALRRGVDILVATPGRLLDLCSQGHIELSEVEFFVLDEADRMLDMGFLPDIRRVLSQLHEERQSLFFSATLSPAIIRLAESILQDPVQVRIEPEQTTAERLDHRVCFVKRENRHDLLLNMLDEYGVDNKAKRTLVFSRTKHGADKLSKFLLKSNIKSGAIHGNKTQFQRTSTLEKFKEGRMSVLVATDVAARGIDIRGISLVINFDLPDEAEAYVHRIGRTARGGDEGRAFSFCTEDSIKELRDIEHLLKATIATHEEHPFHDRSLADRAKKPKSSHKGKGGSGKGKPNGKKGGFRPGKTTHRRRSGRSRPVGGRGGRG